MKPGALFLIAYKTRLNKPQYLEKKKKDNIFLALSGLEISELLFMWCFEQEISIVIICSFLSRCSFSSVSFSGALPVVARITALAGRTLK